MIHFRTLSAGDRICLCWDLTQGWGQGRMELYPRKERKCRKSGQAFRECTGVCQHRGPNRWGPWSQEGVTAELANRTTMAEMKGLMGRRL